MNPEMFRVERYLQDAERIAKDLHAQAGVIDRIIDILFKAWRGRKPVFIVGNGGSASTATHFAADLVKTVVEKPGDVGVKAFALADNIPLVSAATNDWGWDSAYDFLATFWEPEGVVIALSVNGGKGRDKAGVYSQNLLRALRFAKEHGGKAVGFVGNKYAGGVFKDICDECLIVPDGATPLVESFHVLLHHGIVFQLKEMIANYYKESR